MLPPLAGGGSAYHQHDRAGSGLPARPGRRIIEQMAGKHLGIGSGTLARLRRRLPWRVTVLAGLLPFFCTGAHAQLLHEPVVVPQLRCQDATCRRDGMPTGSLPEAVVSSEGLIGAPEGGRNPE